MPRQKKLGRGVALVGAEVSKFGVYPRGVRGTDLFVEAYNGLRETVDKGFDPKDIEALYLGNISSDLFEHQSHMAPAAANRIGLVPVSAVRFEDACASSGVAFRDAIMAIASGIYDVVLAGGIEKMTNLDTIQVTDVLALALDPDSEMPAGQTFPGVYATMATAHMARYSTRADDFMHVGIKSHYNGSLNPKAHFDASIPQIMERRAASALKKGLPEPHWADEWEFLHDPRMNPVIAWPMRLFDCSTVCDGASCALLVAEDLARDYTDRPIHIIGTGQASDCWLAEREELTSIGASRKAAQQAYEMAGIGPQDVQVAQVHDCFTIAEILAMEDVGFYKPGEAAPAVREGQTRLDGKLPINTDGGLKAKGHPIGASGVGMVVELFKQLRGEAGPRQVKNNPGIGLMHNVGAHGSTVVVNIFERRS
jgi:acetyl-CoA C-acetyltransferase